MKRAKRLYTLLGILAVVSVLTFCVLNYQEKQEEMLMKTRRMMMLACAAVLASCVFCMPAYAASGDVAGAIEGTWNTAAGQIKTVVNNVVFPAIDLVLAVFFFGKLGTAYFDYWKHGQFEWAGPAILFACLVFTMTAPLYIWQILGM